MSAELVTELQAKERGATRAATWRIRIVRGLGPLTVLIGLGWALIQPYRLTLHPSARPGLLVALIGAAALVVLVGVLFRLLIAPGLVGDLEE